MSTYHERMQEEIDELEDHIKDCFKFKPQKKLQESDCIYWFAYFGTLVKNKNLTHCEALILAVVFHFIRTGSSHIWYGSNEELSDYTGYGKDSVKKALHSLCKKDFLIANWNRHTLKNDYKLGDRSVELVQEVKKRGFGFHFGYGYTPTEEEIPIFQVNKNTEYKIEG